jgi:4'-phosphopantetheinyl transferase
MHVREDMWMGLADPSAPRTGEIDLWRVDLERDPADTESLFELLSDDEKARANKYLFAKDRGHFIACRATLRKILGGYLEIAPEEVSLSARKYGKPYLATNDNAPRFNVSHSNGIGVIAVSMGREVGVDIEFVSNDPEILSIAPSVLPAAEVERIRSLPPDLQAATFFAAWARKEAVLKAMGDGLSSSEELQRAVTSISHGERSFSWFENDIAKRWSLTTFQVEAGFKAAVVVEGDIGVIRFYNLIES